MKMEPHKFSRIGVIGMGYVGLTMTAAMARGEITPDEAQPIAAMLEIKRKAIETMDLERRLDALEPNGGAQ